MLEQIRSFFQRTLANISPARRSLFISQQALADELRALLMAYERRIEYLQSRLLQSANAITETDRDFFEEAHQGLARITIRLRLADQEADELLQEWRNWLNREPLSVVSEDAKERLEMIRSELALRGLLSQERQGKYETPPKKQTTKRSTYEPVFLSEDPLTAFDEVILPRIRSEKRWIDGAWQQAIAIGARDIWKVWLTRRRKRVWGWARRFTRLNAK